MSIENTKQIGMDINFRHLPKRRLKWRKWAQSMTEVDLPLAERENGVLADGDTRKKWGWPDTSSHATSAALPVHKSPPVNSAQFNFTSAVRNSSPKTSQRTDTEHTVAKTEGSQKTVGRVVCVCVCVCVCFAELSTVSTQEPDAFPLCCWTSYWPGDTTPLGNLSPSGYVTTPPPPHPPPRTTKEEKKKKRKIEAGQNWQLADTLAVFVKRGKVQQTPKTCSAVA